VADKKHKSPLELGEAVAEKIEALFKGGFLDEDEPEELSLEIDDSGANSESALEKTQLLTQPIGLPRPPTPPPPRRAADTAARVVPEKPAAVPPRPPVRPAPPPAPAPRKPSLVPPRPQEQAAPQRPQVPAQPAPARVERKPAPAPPRPQPVTGKAPQPAAAPTGAGIETRPAGATFEDIIEQIEILVLNLEWEANPRAVRDLMAQFKHLAAHFPKEGQARTILAMNLRVLERFSSPGATPHPGLLRLLQDSVAALRQLHSPEAKRAPGESLISALTTTYRDIMGSSTAAARAGEGQDAAIGRDDPEYYRTIVKKVGIAVNSIEDVSRRLERLLGVLRQGGHISAEEITRRLGTLEHLLAERVGQLSSSQQELSGFPPPGTGSGAGKLTRAALPGVAEVILLLWKGIPLAVPASYVSGIYPLTRDQAGKIADKVLIALGGVSLKRLPLREPSLTPNSPPILPAWMVHLTMEDQDFFLLAERSLGFRKTTEGQDLEGQTQIRIGPTAYAVLNRSAFPRQVNVSK